MKYVGLLNGFFWSWGIAFPMIILGIFYTVFLRVPWARLFKQMFRSVKSEKVGDGASAWGTLCTIVGGQVGTGNMVGVATAVASGGPGALFWMWLIALLGMSIMAGESVLAQLYKEKDGKSYKGGTAYYMSNGLHLKKLAWITALVLSIGVGFICPAIHIVSCTDAVRNVFPIPVGMIGFILAGAVTIVHLGGFKRVANFASSVVPVMCVLYIGAALLLVIMNITKVPDVFVMIFTCAFKPSAIAGGAAGYTVKSAFRYGMARGFFSNEAGEGSVSHLSAASSVRHPVTQGLLGSMGVMIDTLIVCTATGLVILCSGADYTKMNGAVLVQYAFSSQIGGFAEWFIALAMLFFAFTTLITATFVGHVNFKYICNNKKAFWVFFAVQMIFTMISCYLPMGAAFEILDLIIAVLYFLNLIAMVGLWKDVKNCFDDYETQLKAGNDDPIFNWDAFRKSKGMAPMEWRENE